MSLEIPMRNQKSRTPKPEIPLRNEKSRTLNAEVIYPRYMFQQCFALYFFPVDHPLYFLLFLIE